MIEVQCKQVEFMYSKKQDREIPYLTVTDLNTGESDLRLWLAGQLKYQFDKLVAERGLLTGLKLLIKNTGKQKVNIDDETYNVNNFEIYELDEVEV